MGFAGLTMGVFAARDGNHKHVGDGIIANEESSLRMSS